MAYDVALSFAGEDRVHAEALSKLLTDAGARVFYDLAEQSKLWGKDLFQHLSSIYGEQSRYCVVFVSAKYLEKLWTRHELKQAQARSFKLDREYILPVRIDDTSLPGLPMTVGYVDLRSTAIPQIALMLLEKLGLPDQGLADEVERASWDGETVNYNGMRVASFWPKRIERAQHQPLALIARIYGRIAYGSEEQFRIRKWTPKANCVDCGALVGQFHVPGCDVEECPSCEGQAISCGCDRNSFTVEQAEAWEERE